MLSAPARAISTVLFKAFSGTHHGSEAVSSHAGMSRGDRRAPSHPPPTTGPSAVTPRPVLRIEYVTTTPPFVCSTARAGYSREETFCTPAASISEAAAVVAALGHSGGSAHDCFPPALRPGGPVARGAGRRPGGGA